MAVYFARERRRKAKIIGKEVKYKMNIYMKKSETKEWDFLTQANNGDSCVISFTNDLTKPIIVILIIVVIIMAIVLVVKIIKKR